MNEEKRRTLELAARHVCPDRVRTFGALGVDLVIGRREGYRIWDLEGRELLDLHLNGGVFNLGHRHPEVVAALREAARHARHRQPPLPERRARRARRGAGAHDAGRPPATSSSRRAAARRSTSPSSRRATPPGGARSSRSARATTATRGSRSPPATSASRASFLSEGAARRVRAGAVQRSRRDGGGAASATRSRPSARDRSPRRTGSRCPSPATCRGVKALCERHGALYVADEVQTGLGRTGRMWGVECFGVVPDMLVTGKGLSGGLYPIVGGRALAARRRLARGGRLGARLDLRRRRARLPRRAEGARDHDAARGAGERRRGVGAPRPRARDAARALRELARRDPPPGRRDGSPLRAPARRADDDARALRRRALGDVRRLRHVGAAVQGRAARRRCVLRRGARAGSRTASGAASPAWGETATATMPSPALPWREQGDHRRDAAAALALDHRWKSNGLA